MMRRLAGVGVALAITLLLVPLHVVTEVQAAPGSAATSVQLCTPTAAQMDPDKVDDALAYAEYTGAFTTQIYRRGCLVGQRSRFDEAPLPLYSASKSIAALVIGRAVTLGYLEVDEPLRTYFPAADATHGSLTVRHLLTQTSGLYFSWPFDIAAYLTDSTNTVLHAPAMFPAGSTFQYAQAPLSLLAAIIEKTTGQDFLAFADRALFRPLGIDRDGWTWIRDRSGTVLVAGGLAMRAGDLGRIGNLLLARGKWRGGRLIDSGFLADAVSGTTAHPGYGYTFWVNHTAAQNDRYQQAHGAALEPIWNGSPPDTYGISGALSQFVVVIPSRDLVVVRVGIPANTGDNRPTALITGESSNRQNKELLRRISSAPTDIAPPPYVDLFDPSLNQPREFASVDDQSADTELVLQVLLGTGPFAGSRCTIALCNSSDAGRAMADYLATLQ